MFANIMISHRFSENDGWLTTPFLYDHELSDKPSEFEIFMALEGYEYQYGFVVTSEKIHEEWLHRRKLSKNETKWSPIFEREEDNIQFNGKAYEKLTDFADIIGEKTLVLSFLGNQSKKTAMIFKDIYNWIVTVFRWNVDESDTEEWAHFYMNYDGLKDAFLDFLNEFDPLVEDIIVEEEMDRDGKMLLRVFTVHNALKVPLEIESEGTQKLFKLYVAIFVCLKLAPSVLIYDELDSQIHPLILRRIVGMFHDKEMNEMGSQLIFTSHNLIVLDNRELRRDEIWFVEKDERGFTTAYSLDSFKSTEKEIRSDMSYGKHYLAGRFGAIPYANPGGGV